MRTGLRFQVRGLDQNARTWNLVQSELEGLKLHPMRVNHYLKWGELIWIQSKDWINFDPVLGLDQYTSPGIQYYHESKIKQYGWLIYSWIINDLRYMFSIACFLLQPHYNETLRVSLYWEQRRHLTVRIKGGGGGGGSCCPTKGRSHQSICHEIRERFYRFLRWFQLFCPTYSPTLEYIISLWGCPPPPNSCTHDWEFWSRSKGIVQKKTLQYFCTYVIRNLDYLWHKVDYFVHTSNGANLSYCFPDFRRKVCPWETRSAVILRKKSTFRRAIITST